MSTREDVQAFNGVLNRLVELCVTLFENIFQSLFPRRFRVVFPPCRECNSKRPHGKGQPGKADPSVTKLEHLTLGEWDVILLAMNPVCFFQPFDQTLRVTLRHHPMWS